MIDQTKQEDVGTGKMKVLLPGGAIYQENPYMNLLTGGLEANDIDVRHSEKFILFPITRGLIRHRDVDVVQLEWIYPFYVINNLKLKPANTVLTFIRAVMLMIDILIVAILPVFVVRTVHNKHHHDRIYPQTERVLNELVFAAIDAIVVKCDRAVDVIESQYITADPGRIHAIPDGSYKSIYENDVSKERAREDLSISEDAFVYLYFGLIREYKGLPDLLQAYTDLKRPDTQLWVVGNPDSEKLEKEISDLANRAADITTVFEFIPADRVQYYMNAADVLVLPYRDILNSGVAYAGLTFGLPIVAPKIGCIPEIVSPENDFLYERDQPNGLRSKLEAARGRPDLESIGDRNYQQAISRDWKRVAAEYDEVYQSLCEN